MRVKYSVLCEPPTTYKRDYIRHDSPLSVKNIIKSNEGCCSEKLKNTEIHLGTISAHDTLQRLNYDSRIPFNALWEPREAVSVNIKPLDKQRYLKDVPCLEDAIKSRPKVYMTPGISLDKVKDSETRKMLINFTYETTTGHANKEVWGEFKPRCFYFGNETSDDKTQRFHDSTYDIPPVLRNVSKWDALQERGFIGTDSKNAACNLKTTKNVEVTSELGNEKYIESLVREDKLNAAYDKFPLSYGGYRPRVALGIPLEKRKLPYDHPNLTVSQVVYGQRDF